MPSLIRLRIISDSIICTTIRVRLEKEEEEEAE
jgi:hypothetical protein